MEASDGYWTSADHILCNPVSVLKSYILNPMVAGCYQDDDPKYANSQFNDFSRVDGFDSDLWNNNERWSAEELKGMEDGELDIKKALEDARNPAVAATPAPAPASPPVSVSPPVSASPVMTAVPCNKSMTQLPKRFVCLSQQNLKIGELYESEWLLNLFGNPSTFSIEHVRPEGPPPTDSPIVIMQRPYVQTVTDMLAKWDSFGAKFSILHLSDEHGTDSLDAYDLEHCEKVLRTYIRPNLPEKVTLIPLGFHWTLHEGSKNMLTITPRLPFRSLTWSFFGTGWSERAKVLRPLDDIPGKHECKMFDTWNDANALSKNDYIMRLLDTVFVPCPDGVNPETFRFYEALECGCLPLLVKTEANALWVDWVCENLQILPLASWEDARDLVTHLMKEKNMLEAYRNKVLQGWIHWRKTLQEEVKAWLTD